MQLLGLIKAVTMDFLKQEKEIQVTHNSRHHHQFLLLLSEAYSPVNSRSRHKLIVSKQHLKKLKLSHYIPRRRFGGRGIAPTHSRPRL
jgi:hypothetical protein